MSVNIWGINPKTGKAECYALRMPEEEAERMVREARRLGWRKVAIGTVTESWPAWVTKQGTSQEP